VRCLESGNARELVRRACLSEAKRMHLFTLPRWSQCLLALWIPVMAIASFQLFAIAQGKESPVKYTSSYRTIQVDGLSIFYREAGSKDAPTLLLLHGLPSSSRMFEPAFRPAFRSLSPCRARLPRLRAQRLAGSEKIRVYVRSRRRNHESFHRGARTLALHALHAGLRGPRGFSNGISPSGPE
jgi:hypothetical protein